MSLELLSHGLIYTGASWLTVTLWRGLFQCILGTCFLFLYRQWPRWQSPCWLLTLDICSIGCRMFSGSSGNLGRDWLLHRSSNSHHSQWLKRPDFLDSCPSPLLLCGAGYQTQCTGQARQVFSYKATSPGLRFLSWSHMYYTFFQSLRRPRTHNLKKERFNLAHSFRGFCPWLTVWREKHHDRRAW